MDDPRVELLIRYGGDFWPEPVVRAQRLVSRDGVGGSRVLDFTAGQICATIGHNHPRVAAAIQRALDERRSTSTRGCSRRRCSTSPTRCWRHAPALARARDLPLDRRRVDRGRGADGEAVHRPVRGRLAHAQLARADGGAASLDAGRRPARLRAAAAGRRSRCRRRTPTAARSAHCDGDVRLHLPGGGFDLFDQASVGSPAARGRRAGAVGGRRDRAAAGLLRAAARAVRRARDARDLRRVPDRARPARDDVRLRALRRRAGLPRALEDARRRGPDRRGGDERDDRGATATSAASCT